MKALQENDPAIQEESEVVENSGIEERENIPQGHYEESRDMFDDSENDAYMPRSDEDDSVEVEQCHPASTTGSSGPNRIAQLLKMFADEKLN